MRGKQIYLGGFDTEQAAARAYDIASLKFWGSGTETNVSYLGVPCSKQEGGDRCHSLQLAESGHVCCSSLSATMLKK